MHKDKKPKPVSLTDKLVYIVYLALEGFIKLLPMKFVFLLGSGLGHLSYLLLRKRRQIVHRNLRIAFGETMSISEIDQLAKKNFQNIGANLIASFKTATLRAEEIKNCVEVTGEEHLKKAKQGNKGIIVLLSHIGNWELMAQIHLILPELTPTATLYRPLDNPLIDDLIKKRRGSQGTLLFSKRDGFFKPMSHLKGGGALGILADQFAGRYGIATPFFGKLSSFTNLPAIMHRRTESKILPLFMETTGAGKWKVNILPALKIPQDKIKDAAYITAIHAQSIECMMKKSPKDVFWMHGYWKIKNKKPLKIQGSTKHFILPSPPSTTQPFHILIHLGDSTELSPKIKKQLSRLKNYRQDAFLTTIGNLKYPETDNHINNEKDTNNLSKKIYIHEKSLIHPIDCALDFTSDGSGEKILNKAEITPLYSYFSYIKTHQKKPTLTDFLTSLGLPSNT